MQLELTEVAIGLEHAAFRLGSEEDFGPSPRITKSTLGPLYGPTPQQLRAQAVYLRSISIVEAYIDTLSSSLFADHAQHRDDLFRRLASMAQEQSESSWDTRKENFRQHHDVVLGDRKKYSDIDAATVIRNAIAHGLGALTRRQRNSKDRAKVTQVGVTLSDDRVIISDAALDRLRTSTVTFIADVDASLPHAPRGL